MVIPVCRYTSKKFQKFTKKFQMYELRKAEVIGARILNGKRIFQNMALTSPSKVIMANTPIEEVRNLSMLEKTLLLI